MNILTRYVCFEMAKVFLITLSSLTALMLIVGVVQEAVRENLTPLTILQLVPYVLPNALCFAIPGTALFSTCMVLGRMASANEVVAVKSMGISPTAFVKPVITMAVGMSLLTVYLNDLAVSWGRTGVYQVVLNSVEKTIYAVLNTQGSYQNGRVSIFVDGVEDNALINPVVQIYDQDNGGEIYFTADSAQLSVDSENECLLFSVKNAKGQFSDNDVNAVLPDGVIPIPLRDATRTRKRDESPSNLPLRVIPDEIRYQREKNATENRKLAMLASFQLLGGDFVSATHPRWPVQLQNLGVGKERVFRLQTEPWRRWANGFSCLFFVLVGAPLAIHLRKADFWSTFGLCFIPILMLYYPMLMYGVGRAKAGDLPPPIVWLGNLVLFGISWFLIRKIVRN